MQSWLCVRATSRPWETLYGGQSYLSCGDGCVSGNAVLTGALPLVRPFFLAFFTIYLSVSETGDNRTGLRSNLNTDWLGSTPQMLLHYTSHVQHTGGS